MLNSLKAGSSHGLVGKYHLFNCFHILNLAARKHKQGANTSASQVPREALGRQPFPQSPLLRNTMHHHWEITRIMTETQDVLPLVPINL